MLKRLRQFLIISLCLSPFALVAAPAAVYANDASTQIQCGINEASGGNCGGSVAPSDDLASVIKKVLNILSAVAGVLAIIMIMVAGIRLVTSAGSEAGVKGAKGTLIYAVVGLIIVAFAQIIVHFVIHSAASS